MKNILVLLLAVSVLAASNCGSKKTMTKGFQVSSAEESSEGGKGEGLHKDSLKFETRASSVLITGVPHIRLTSLFKVNYKKDNKSFIGSNNFIRQYLEEENGPGNKWNFHIVPGFEAVYGYNFVNVSLNNLQENKQKLFFDKPVLIKTLYYPTPEMDTLNFLPVRREYFLVSVYNEDTNKDGFINLSDLRRIYLFSLKGELQKALVPENYSVYKSEYDAKNDLLFVFAQLDANDNGSRDESEPTHVFWIDLKNPTKTGRKF